MARLLLSFSLLICASALSAQVFINEICASNLAGLADGDGDREDWFELFNAGGSAVNISGWFFSDDPAEPQKWVVPSGQTIAANGYKIIFCSGKDKVQGIYLHTNFKLTQTKGESVVVTMPNGTTVDSYTFDVPNQTNHSYARVPSGGATWKILTTPSPNAGNNGTSFTSYAPKVQTDIPGGFYPGSVSVALSVDPGFTIRYTTDGSEPTSTSTLYSTPVSITSTKVLKTRAFSADPQILPGFVTYHTYFINANHTIPVISIAGNTITNLMGGSQITPVGSFEYYVNGEQKADGYGEFNKHGNDSWAYQQRGIDWITRDQMGYDNELNYKFFPERERKKFQRLILKAGANDNYPAANGAHIRDSYTQMLALKGGMELDVRTHVSAVLYVNGQYWGVYDLREKVDDSDYTDYYYDQDELDVDFIKTWGSTWAEYGSITEWNALKAFILGSNMTNAANYAYANERLDFLSLIDYVIINQHSVCKDWLNWNTAWWRGRNPDGTAKKWRYTLWDMDATFGHYINYTGIPNTGPTADPCDVEQISNSGDPQNHIDIFMALYANPAFKQLYVNRYADLLNTTLSCEYMNAYLDTLINIIAPEMAQHCTRWGGTVNNWNQNVATLHNFINSRCQLIEQSIGDCYDVTGPFNLTVNVSPASSPNQVRVNTITPTVYPYLGNYFGGINIDLEAKPAQGWLFDHWEVAGNTFSPDQYADAIALAFQTTGVVTAFFVEIAPCHEPTDLTVTTNSVSTIMDWTDQQLAMNYVVLYRKEGDLAWSQATAFTSNWDFDVLPGCTEYEVQVMTACPQGTSDSVYFTFNTPDYLAGFALADASFCNAATGTTLDASFTGANYEWNDGTTASTLSVTDTGEYWVTLTLNGCSLTDTALVTQNFATASIHPSLCEEETFTIGTASFDAQNPSGTVILPGLAVGGCDSLVEVNLAFLMPSQASIAATSCNPASVGVDTLYLTNFVGCDSLVITTTTFDASAIPVTQLSALNCDINSVGVDTLVLTSFSGCDSLVVTTTTLAPFSQIQLSATSCNPNAIGTDTLTYINALGCDSLVVTTTTFDANAVPVTQLSALNCDINSIGVDTLVLTSFGGCDSLVVTTTSLAPFSQIQLSATSCNPNAIGTDTLTLVNALGCDSLIITTTTFDANAIPVTQLSALNCDINSVGVDTLVLTSFGGCDSLVVTTTSLAPFSQTLLSATSCNPNAIGTDTLMLVNALGCDSLVITTTNFDASAISVTQLTALSCDANSVGMDTLVLTSFWGCDSLVVTTTSLSPTSQTFIAATSCDPGDVGTQTLVLTNQWGCDSTIVTTTTLAPTSQTFLTATTCDLAAAGIATTTLVNQWGCDSLVTTTTTFVGVDFTPSAQDEFCFGANDGQIQMDTAITTQLPVAFVLENNETQLYTGSPLNWEGLAPGLYQLTATNAAGCTVSQEIAVGEANPLVLDFGQIAYNMHLGDSIWVSPTANFQIETAEWLPLTGVKCPTCPATYLAAQQTMDYTLLASDENGCATSATLTVEVDESVRVYVPTALRPGSDNSPNADFIIFAGPEVKKVKSVLLFDRWGDQVFEQYDFPPNVPTNWDGTYRGKLVPQGVFIWLATFETVDGRVVNKSGDITVLR